MTRVNVGIKPKELPDKLLLAEHREIKRIPNCVAKGRYSMKHQPREFTLGKGHVKFFYDKMAYLKKRYTKLYWECIDRGFKVEFYGLVFDEVPKDLFHDYEERIRDRKLILKRFKEKGHKLIKKKKR